MAEYNQLTPLPFKGLINLFTQLVGSQLHTMTTEDASAVRESFERVSFSTFRAKLQYMFELCFRRRLYLFRT